MDLLVLCFPQHRESLFLLDVDLLPYGLVPFFALPEADVGGVADVEQFVHQFFALVICHILLFLFLMDFFPIVGFFVLFLVCIWENLIDALELPLELF